MIINHNIGSMNASRMINNSVNVAGKAMEKLSSGLRINRARDDAAGLVISEKMRGQIRGLDQASRNIQDAISLIQTSEGGMNEVHSLLQRGRELSIQAANSTNSKADTDAVQNEIIQIVEEIDRISVATEFNTIKLLDKNPNANDEITQNIINGIKSGWLQESANLIDTYYGLSPSNRNMTVNIQQGTLGGILASINSSWNVSGATATLTKLTLYIEKVDLSPSTGVDGNNPYGDMYNDRIIAHEMVHAVMADTMGDAFYDLPSWFKEGTAEFLPGADTRLKQDVANAGTVQSVIDRGFNLITGVNSWGDAGSTNISKDYSAGYLAIKYLNEQLSAGKTMKDFLNDLTLGMGLDAAIAGNTTYANLSAFATDFKNNGAAYYGTLNMQGLGVAELDTGSIMGVDHLNDGTYDAHSVIPTGIYMDNPTNFNIIFPTVDSSNSKLSIQVGANSDQLFDIKLCSVKPSDLNIDFVDVSTDAQGAIQKFGDAITIVSSNRALLGALQNRLEHAFSINEITAENLTEAESRIRDVNMAKAMSEFAKANIITQAAQAMLAQANQQPQQVLQLLKA